jgi:ribosomal RNA-processing protein 7
MSEYPIEIGEFTTLPLSLPTLPSYPTAATHCLYIRKHAPKIPNPNDSRSLFLVNVPFDSTEAHFRAIFNGLVGAGRFESISFEGDRKNGSSTAVAVAPREQAKSSKRKRGNEKKLITAPEVEPPSIWDRELHHSGSNAVVLMADEKSVMAVLKAVRKVHRSREYPVWGKGAEDKVPKLGSERYLTHLKLRCPDRAVIQASVDAYMLAFNESEEAAAREAKRARNVADEDGFVTVTRGSRVGPARKEEAEEARRRELEKEEKKRKAMGDFYRFQGRERRKEEQGELLKRFEEDRKKIEEMRKEKRGRFKPE